MYSITFSKVAEKQFRKLDRSLQSRIMSTLDRIRIRPEAHIKRLVGENCYRLRVGDYRVILDIEAQQLQILVLKIGKRENIYD